MSLLRTLPRARLANTCWQARRLYVTKDAARTLLGQEDDLNTAKSCCTEGTILTGLNWLKDQPSITAKPDEAYPEWLWKLLEPKPIPNDGPGGKGERILMRKQNRARIRETNFMQTQ